MLRFPKPILTGAQVERDAAFGLRTKGVTIEELSRSGVIDFAPDVLTRDFGGVTELRLDPNSPIRVFRPTPTGNPELRPTFRGDSDQATATLETAWQIGPKRADAKGILRWSGKDSPEMVEFALPGVKVVEVRGAEVASWTQIGARVQVWFRRSVRDGEVEWLGTVAAPTFPFDAVTPRLTDLRLLTDTVRLDSAVGFAANVERDRGWTAIDNPGESVARRTTNATAPPVRVVLSSVPRMTRAEDLGWLSPSYRPRATARSTSCTPCDRFAPPRRQCQHRGDRRVWPVYCDRLRCGNSHAGCDIIRFAIDLAGAIRTVVGLPVEWSSAMVISVGASCACPQRAVHLVNASTSRPSRV